MKKLLAIFVVSIAVAGAAYAGCSTQTIMKPGGPIQICTYCCDGFGNCTLTCY